MYYLILGIGLLILIKGADIFVESASKLAKLLKIPSFVIGLFVVAIGTSAPEATIGIISGISRINHITLGDVVGSSIINIAVVVGITAMIIPLKIDSIVSRTEVLISIFVQVCLLFFIFTFNIFSRIEAIILIAGMILFSSFTYIKSKKVYENRSDVSKFDKEICEYIEMQGELVGDEDPESAIAAGKACSEEKDDNVKKSTKDDSIKKRVILLIIGLIGLAGGAQLSVNSAVNIARELGLSEIFIGLTVIAFGTSLPELVTCITAAFKRDHDIAIGNVIGSNIFNVLFVLGISGILHPIAVNNDIYLDIFVMIGFSVLFSIFVLFIGKISRMTGFLFFSLYVIYMAIKISIL